MRLLTTKKERMVVMEQPRKVSKAEKFASHYSYYNLRFVAAFGGALIGMLMLGNLFRSAAWLTDCSTRRKRAN